MYADTLFEQSSETNRVAAFYKALMSVDDMDNTLLLREYRMDDPYETDCGPEIELSDDECWMDDLDEAA
jgi:hypothetical protein